MRRSVLFGVRLLGGVCDVRLRHASLTLPPTGVSARDAPFGRPPPPLTATGLPKGTLEMPAAPAEGSCANSGQEELIFKKAAK